MTPCCRSTFYLLAHVSLLQYSRSSNVFTFRRTLGNISTWYPYISFSWTQWVKNNNRPNYSQELKRVLAWPSSHYSNYPLSFFFFMHNLLAHDVVATLIYFCFSYTLFFLINLKEVCVNVGKCSSFRRIVKPFLAWFSWDGILYATSISQNLIKKKCYIQHTYAIFFIVLLTFLTHWESQCVVDRLWKKLLYMILRIVDINERFNIYSTISYYNVKHIKDNRYDA